MTTNTSLSSFRIPLYRSKDVEVQVCVANGKASLEISNSSSFPRVISLSNVWASHLGRTRIVRIGSHCLRKMPWSISDYPRLRKIEIKVSDPIEETPEI